MPLFISSRDWLTPALKTRTLGLVGRAARAVHTLASRLVYGDTLVLLRLPGVEANRAFAGEVPGIDMRFLSAQEVVRYRHQAGTDLHLPYVDDALARGDRCFALLDGDRLASYSWYATGPTGVTKELELHFPRPHIYMHHSFTAAAYRGRRLHTIGIVRALAQLEAERPVTLLAIVSLDNAASLASCTRAGYRALGKFWLLGSANHLGVYASPDARAYGCELMPRRPDFGFIALPTRHQQPGEDAPRLGEAGAA